MAEFFRRVSIRKRKIGDETRVGIKASTTDTYYRKLMVFFRWLENNEYVPIGSLSEKVMKPPLPKYTDERALSKDEVARLIAATTIHRANNAFARLRDQLIFFLLLYTGIRRGELLGLRVQDVDLEKDLLFINGETSKSRKDRYMPIHQNLRSTLIDYFSLRAKKNIMSSSLVVSLRKDTGLTAHGLKHWVKKYKDLSGVAFHLHRCRHTFACNLSKAGADVNSIMQLLGHNSLNMTQRYLRSIKNEESKYFINKLPL